MDVPQQLLKADLNAIHDNFFDFLLARFTEVVHAALELHRTKDNLRLLVVLTHRVFDLL